MTVQQINVDALQSTLQTPNFGILIDVREPAEWEGGHLLGAHLIPQGILPEQIHLIAPDFNTPIYLYCRSGGRSLQSSKTLLALGYEDVFNVEGGILAWEAAGYQVVK